MGRLDAKRPLPHPTLNMNTQQIQQFLDEGTVPPFAKCDKLVEEIEQQLELAKRMRHAASRRRKIRCTSCGKLHIVGKLTYIQTHHYVKPFGCTGGDYWTESEGQYICPSCGHRNRSFCGTSSEPKIKQWKYSFDKIEKVYEH